MNKDKNPLFTLSFPEAKGIVVSGDIHGDFNQLVFKLCLQYRMRDTLLIVAGDCGFGFEKKESYENMVKRNSRRMDEANNWIVFVRGNHDNPAYFDGHAFKHRRFIAVPDYTIIQNCSHTILCVGGAISIDRQHRINEWKYRQMRSTSTYTNDATTNSFLKNTYWSNEPPLFDEKKMDTIHLQYSIDTVITHTAPSFCELFAKGNLSQWAESDTHLIADVKSERATMDKLHERIVQDHHPVTHWCYAHFHQSWHCSIHGILFKMLDIMEFYPIY